MYYYTTGRRAIVLYCLLLAQAAAAAAGGCPSGWVPGTGGWCWLQHGNIRGSATSLAPACRALHAAAIPAGADAARLAPTAITRQINGAVWVAAPSTGACAQLTRSGATGQPTVESVTGDERCRQRQPLLCRLCGEGGEGGAGCLCRSHDQCRHGTRCGTRHVCTCSRGRHYSAESRTCVDCPDGWLARATTGGGSGRAAWNAVHCYTQLPAVGAAVGGRLDRQSSETACGYLGQQLRPPRTGHLLTVTSADEQSRVQSASWAGSMYWLALDRGGASSRAVAAAAGQFRWSTGERLDYTNWANRGVLREPNMPPQANGSVCAVWLNIAYAGHGWADVGCEDMRADVACEFEYFQD